MPINPHYDGHQTYKHLLLIFIKGIDKELTVDKIVSEFKLWVGFDRRGRIYTEFKIMLYDKISTLEINFLKQSVHYIARNIFCSLFHIDSFLENLVVAKSKYSL